MGDTVYVSGQTGYDENFQIVVGGMEAQMRQAYATIGKVLEGLGSSLADVVDETLFVTDVMAWRRPVRCAPRCTAEVPRVASTLVEVNVLGSPDMMIEIKCQARIGS